MQTLSGIAIHEDGTQGRRTTLYIDDGRDMESGSPLTWSMEKQTDTHSLPVIRPALGIWSVMADDAERCAKVLGPAKS